MKLTPTQTNLSRRKLLWSAGATALLAAPLAIPATKALAKIGRKLDEFIGYDALGLADLIKSKQITQAELVEIFIRRIEVINPAINFMTNRTFERAQKNAKSGTFGKNTRFAGVPILMKDLINIKGLPITHGSKLFKDNIAAKGTHYTDAVERAGLNIIGLTNVPEMASFIMTSNELFGSTYNPWDMDYSVFSSSGGAAAAVATGVVPMAHGTDGAGSNRLPSSATGVYGMKPTRYRQLSGEVDGSHSTTKTNQMISRTVRDNAAAFDATEDKSGGHYKPVGFVKGPSKRRLKVGYVTSNDNQLLPMERDVRRAQARTAQLLENMGHKVEEIAWPFDDAEVAKHYAAVAASRTGPLIDLVRRKSGTTDLMKTGLLTPLLASSLVARSRYTPADFAQSTKYMRGLVASFDTVFKNFDVLLAPVSPVVCPRLNEHSYNDLWDAEMQDYVLSRLKFTAPVNFGEVPAMSVPLGFSAAGMPIGSHFIAARGNDRLLYELAYELEDAKPWKNKWAPNSLQFIPV